MRILLANHCGLDDSSAGAETRELALGLAAAGHEVECLVCDAPTRCDDDARIAIRRVVCRSGDAAADLPFEAPRFTARDGDAPTFATLGDQQLGAYREAQRRALDRAVVEFDPHVIHCLAIWVQGHLALESGAPYVLSATGDDLSAFLSLPRYRRIVEEAAENAGRVVAPSKLLAEQVADAFGQLDGRIAVVPPGIDIEAFPDTGASRADTLRSFGVAADRARVVAFAGALASSRGVDVLLDAAARYEPLRDNVWTLVAGDGAAREGLEAQARGLGLRRLRWLGRLSRRECARLFAAADVVAAPTRGGAVGRAPLEALAAGAPVIAAANSGLEELVSPEIGQLVAVDDAAALSAAVVRAIDEDWKTTRGPAARQFAAHERGVRRWIERLTAIYRDVVQDRGGEIPPPPSGTTGA